MPIRRNAVKTVKLIPMVLTIVGLLSVLVASSGIGGAKAASPKTSLPEPSCQAVGGTISTNFGAIDANTTMGTATGDLRGSVSGTLLGAPVAGPGGTVVFHVRHHWVTESGETLHFDPATLTTVPLSATLFRGGDLSGALDRRNGEIRGRERRIDGDWRGRFGQGNGVPV